MNVVNNDVTRQKKATNQEKIWRMRRDFKLMDNCSRPQEEESHIRVQHTKLSRQRKKEPKIARDNVKDFFERFKTEDLSRTMVGNLVKNDLNPICSITHRFLQGFANV